MKVLWILILSLFSLHLIADESYTTCFEGVSSELLTILESRCQLKSLEKRPPSHFFSLKCRAESDRPNILNILHAYGYYDAQVSFSFVGNFPSCEVKAIIQSGPQYYFGNIQFVDCEGNESFPIIMIEKESLATQLCNPACNEDIFHTEEQILKQLDSQGFPLAKIVEKQVIVDKEAKQVYITFVINAGEQAHFGQVEICGLTSVNENFVLKRILWHEGDLYDPRKIIKTDIYLQESGLFSQIEISPGEEIDTAGMLPMTISVCEVKHRHIGAGLSYSTDESLGFIFEWDHENFCHNGENLAFIAEASKVIKRIGLEYCIPDFCHPYQQLSYSGEIKREDTLGFIEREASVTAEVYREVGKWLDFSYGLRFEKLISTHSDNNHNFNLISLPLYLHWNRSDDFCNPTKGGQFCYQIAPYQNLFTSSVFFLKQEMQLSLYFPICKDAFILATSCQLGSIAGQSRLNIPPPKRFYLGSACDLRGYAYKTVSPLEGTKPIGGRSYFLAQVEPRIRVAKKLYLITFFDCGNAYTSAFPNFDEILRRSFGLGFRYLTGLGPLRFDIAFPLDRRKEIDSSFQIYASIGQAF